ncbi:MAG: hypothetical protein OQK76_11305 [Gammaproteobacteria bacterium]|nr:hypothetical protein [Gammaproteobacteria bacterium]MCW8911192.1 hypothetical protein [Gammaproteobacteria bacterium]MCW9055394.1 hypothetical protein [Gammaproteobacteria bacterium]
MKKIFTVIPLMALMVCPAYAQNDKASRPLLDRNELSIGGGLSLNSVSGPLDDEVGFQFFAAYDLDRVNLMQGVNTSVEFGYMDYGFSGRDTGGLWVTGLIDGAIQNNFGWLARLGLDLGDDSGLMVGAGLSFGINSRLDLRGEYVIRDEIDSLQLNLIYRL